MGPKLTHELLKSMLDYDENTGIFTWKINTCRRKIGTTAGYKMPIGYMRIKLNYKGYYSHRLAWFYVYGEWPKNEIDHVDGNKQNNSIKNLRDVTHRKNCTNFPHHRKGRLAGTYFNKKWNKWIAMIRYSGKEKTYLGAFDSEQDAHNAYILALGKLTE